MGWGSTPHEVVRAAHAARAAYIYPYSEFDDPNLAAYARDHALPYQRLLWAWHGGLNKKNRQPTNTKLTEAQDLALKRFINGVDDIRFSVHKGMVEAEANAILAEAYTLRGNAEPPPTVSRHWAKRWLHNYKE
jgi:hypothetical protein